MCVHVCARLCVSFVCVCVCVQALGTNFRMTLDLNEASSLLLSVLPCL